MATEQHFIAIAGNIGAGKSTLTNMLAQSLNWKPFYEANADNPYLSDFYQDMQRWSFHSQVFFLGKRLEHHRKLVDHPGSVVQDRTVYEDAEIFARNLMLQGQMSARDYDSYCSLYEAIASFLPPPSLIIYLKADVSTLVERIQHRGRDFEQDISTDYLAQLNTLYDDWIGNWTACDILTIETNGLDFQHRTDDYTMILERVQQMITPTY
jgi:deoxyadenosine/deoxycytidine kinase